MSHEINLCNVSDLLQQLNENPSRSNKYFYDMLYDISVTLFDKRMELNKTQKEFADILGVSQVMVSKYESGDYNFSIKQICNIAEKLNLKPSFKLVDKLQQIKLFNCNNIDSNIDANDRIFELIEEAV